MEAEPRLVPALSMRSLVKVYGDTIAVADLNLDIPKGSFYGIVGPNGAGKTTTLAIATGLLVPDRGTAYVEGVDVWVDPVPAKKILGVMPDGLRVFDRLSGPDYLTYVALLRGLAPDVAFHLPHLTSPGAGKSGSAPRTRT